MSQRLRKAKPPKDEPVKIDRRLVALIAVPLILCMIGFATYLTVINGPKKLTDADRAMLRDYDGIRAALFRDELLAAKEAAIAFVQTYGTQNPFSEHAASLSKATSLDLARAAFSRMSEEATKLAYRHSEYFAIGCSMELCPVECSPCRMGEYANWVQLQPEIENPYMGKVSPHCGIVKRW